MRARWCFACAHRRRRHPCLRRAFIWAGRVRAPPPHHSLAVSIGCTHNTHKKMLVRVCLPSNFCGRAVAEPTANGARRAALARRVVRQRRRTAAPVAPRWAMDSVSELSERLALPLDHETVRQAGLLSGAFIVGCCAFWCCVQPLLVWCRRRVRHGEPVLM